MAHTVEARLDRILTDVAKSLKIGDFTRSVDARPLEGYGFLSHMYKISLETADKELQLIVKRRPTPSSARPANLIDSSFKNERHFYRRIMLKYRKLQGVVMPIAKHYPVSDEDMIVLEDLTQKGFLRRTHFFYDDVHLRKIFEVYGRFHAFSYGIQNGNIKNSPLFKLVTPLDPTWQYELDNPDFVRTFVQLADIAYNALDETRHKGIAKAFKKYTTADEFKELFLNMLDNESDYACVLHGDCGSNNIMFKYRSPQDFSNILEVNLIDFQQVHVGSPVCDLASVLYLAESKDLFKNLDEYLKIYHASALSALKAMGNAKAKLLSIENIKQEWSKYGKLGLILSLLFTKLRLMTTADLIACARTITGNEDVRTGTPCRNFDEQIFCRRIIGVLEHLHSFKGL